MRNAAMLSLAKPVRLWTPLKRQEINVRACRGWSGCSQSVSGSLVCRTADPCRASCRSSRTAALHSRKSIVPNECFFLFLKFQIRRLDDFHIFFDVGIDHPPELVAGAATRVDCHCLELAPHA